MTEIMVSVLIFALSIAGLLAAISSLNRPAVESFEEIQATYIGKQFFEQLRQGVDARTWDQPDSLLAPTGQPEQQNITIDGVRFTTSYNVVAATPEEGGGRWVTMRITWQ